MHIVDKELFINAAQSLEGSYDDYGLCLYTIAKQSGVVNDVYEYMTTQAKNSDDLDEAFYEFLGRPNPQITIIDKLPEKECINA